MMTVFFFFFLTDGSLFLSSIVLFGNTFYENVWRKQFFAERFLVFFLSSPPPITLLGGPVSFPRYLIYTDREG